MNGDREHPISFRLEPRPQGEHVLVTVRAGHRPDRAVAGILTFRREEWAALREVLAGRAQPGLSVATGEGPVWVDQPPVEVHE